MVRRRLCFNNERNDAKRIRMGKCSPPKSKPLGPPRKEKTFGPTIANFYRPGENRNPIGYGTRSHVRPFDYSFNELVEAPSTKRRKNTIEDSSDNDGNYTDNNDYGNIDEPNFSTPLQSKQKSVITSSKENDYAPDSSFSTPRRVPPIQRTYSSLIVDQILAEEKEHELKRRREKSGVEMENNDNESADDEGQFENNSIENSEDEYGQFLSDQSEDDDSIIDNDMNGQGDCKLSRSSSLSESSSTDPFPSGSDSSSGTLHSEGSLFHIERFHDKTPDFRNIELVTKPSFNKDDGEQSELSGYSMTDEESLDALSEFSDFDYQHAKKYYGADIENITRKQYMKITVNLIRYVQTYWSKVKELNDKRSDMIYVLNKQLKKSRSFSNTDVVYFNIRIDAIQSNLNSLAPAITKFQARFVKDSKQRLVIFNGHKYALVRSRPELFSCPYANNPNDLGFGPHYGCKGSLYLDEKGFLQPMSFVQHHHEAVKELENFPEEPTPELANLWKITHEGNEPGNREKMNKFLEEKLKEASEYSFAIREVKTHIDNIREFLNRLESLNAAELIEADAMYLQTSVEWVKLIMLHVKIVNVPQTF